MIIPSGKSIEHKWSIECQEKDGTIEFRIFLRNHHPQASPETTFSPLPDGYHTDSSSSNQSTLHTQSEDSESEEIECEHLSKYICMQDTIL